MTSLNVGARVTIWKPERSPESEFGAYFGQPIPGSTIIEDLRIQFAVDKDDESTSNKASITITNLSEQTRAELTRRPLRVILEAGYAGSLSIIAAGDLASSPSSEYDGSTWTTELLIKDGGRALKYARVNKSLRGTPSAFQLAQECITALGLRAPSNLASFPELQRQWPHGVVAYGLASDQLTRTLRPFGIGWSIQDGQIKISRGAEPTDDSLVVVDEDAGLIGFPQLAPPPEGESRPVLTFETLLFPELTVGRKVRLRSKTVNGDFKIKAVSHQGDTAEEGAQTSVEARPI